jgi:5-oxoprolinase (ATP-hydrolysing) subunit A
MFNTGGMVAVDLNADLAEGEVFTPADLAVVSSVTSVSIACGFHAGNRAVMRATAEACVARGVIIGAHVSFRDRDGFGRRTLDVEPDRLVRDIVEQCAVLAEEVESARGTVAYIKPHGALYHQMSVDPEVAASVIEAVSHCGHRVLVAQPGTVVIDLAHDAGVRTVPEGFPDRGYLPDGRLAPRNRPDGLVDDPGATARRAVAMVEQVGIEAVDGSWAPLTVETLCIHGDALNAASRARAVRAALEAAGIGILAFTGGDPSESPR